MSLERVYYELARRNLESTNFGKPHSETYIFATNALADVAKRLKKDVGQNIYAVGDNLASDIAGANKHGWKSLLVKTGVYKDGAHDADHLVEDVDAAVRLALRNEGLD
jgi:ribonucleotide monophosphatase NagD (HAD superfamily)